MSNRIHNLLASLLILVGACSDNGSDSATDGSSSAGSSGSATDETGDTTTGDATTDEPTTGEPAEPPVECAAHCEKQVSCDFFASVDECLEWCADEYTRSFPACQEATGTYLGCMAALSCEELSAFDPDADPCAAEQAPMYDLCNDEYDYCGVSTGTGGGECDLAIECDEGPLLEMKCTDTTCTCLSAGVMVGSCDAEGICGDSEALLEKSEPCCGF